MHSKIFWSSRTTSKERLRFEFTDLDVQRHALAVSEDLDFYFLARLRSCHTVAKLIHVVNGLAVSEALLLAKAGGLDLDATIEAVKGGGAGSWMLANRGPQIVDRDWRPGFTIDLQQKDLRLVLESADELAVPLPATSLVFQMYRALQRRGLGHEGNHGIVKALEEMAGLEVTRE